MRGVATEESPPAVRLIGVAGREDPSALSDLEILGLE